MWNGICTIPRYLSFLIRFISFYRFIFRSGILVLGRTLMNGLCNHYLSVVIVPCRQCCLAPRDHREFTSWTYMYLRPCPYFFHNNHTICPRNFLFCTEIYLSTVYICEILCCCDLHFKLVTIVYDYSNY